MTSPLQECPASLIAAAHELANIAGPIARKYFRTPVNVIDKSDASPVTIADRETEAAIRARISGLFPDHGIYGEEHGNERIDAEYVWVLDPIDGTRAFISGQPTFGILIALLYRGAPILGILDQPITGERWQGAQGRSSLFNGLPIKSRTCSELADATFFTTDPDLFPAADLAVATRLRKSCKMARYGLDCYAYGLVASGFVDVVAEAGLKPYDFSALVPIINGAGGMMTDWQGKPLGLHSDGHVLASGNAALHAKALEILAE